MLLATLFCSKFAIIHLLREKSAPTSTVVRNTGVGRIFTRGGGCYRIFPEVAIKIFPKGLKSGEISFFLLKTNTTTFFAKNVIEKCQISKSRKAMSQSPCPTFRRPRVGRCFSSCKFWGNSRCHYLQIAFNLFSRQSLCD